MAWAKQARVQMRLGLVPGRFTEGLSITLIFTICQGWLVLGAWSWCLVLALALGLREEGESPVTGEEDVSWAGTCVWENYTYV